MATLVLELPASLEQQLNQAAAEAGQNTAEFARAALEEKLAAVGGGVGPSAWRELVRIGDSLPKEERERLPADASENLDHYLYGSPKMRP